MGIGTSIFLIAVGAILDFAIEVNTPGFNLHTIGAILMIVGAIGALLSMIFWSSWGGFRRTTTRTVYDDGYDAGPPVRRRIIDEDIR